MDLILYKILTNKNMYLLEINYLVQNFGKKLIKNAHTLNNDLSHFSCQEYCVILNAK